MNDLFIQGLTIDWNRVRPYNYVRQIPAISGIDTFTFHKPITFFVGENGSGKSTLLEAIAVAYGFNAEGGTKNYSFSTYNSHSELCEAMTISKGYRRPKFGYFLRAESFYNVATKEIDYSDDDHPSKGYHQKSHGESFLAIAQDYMGADGVYIFDEPEAALSPQRQLTLLINIYRCAQEGAQFIIVSHSPILLGMPDAEIFSFDNGTIHPCQYEDTDSYVITKTFVNLNRMAILTKTVFRPSTIFLPRTLSTHSVPQSATSAAKSCAPSSGQSKRPSAAETMKGASMNMSSNLNYTQTGDYLLPNLTLHQPKNPLGKYGRLRRTYLMNHRPVLYHTMLLNGSLYPTLTELEQTAAAMKKQLMADLLAKNPAPDKEKNQMAWVQHMNSLQEQVEEVIRTELIYS